MCVDVLRDNRFAIVQALPTRAAAQLAELSVLRVNVTDFNLPRRFGGLGLAFAAARIPRPSGHRTAMKKGFFLYRWFRDVSIARKLYFTVGIMALLIGVELFVLFFSLNTLSSLRAYVGGEGLWSKAQKDAVFHLYRYGTSRTEKDYELFEQFMHVPIGDAKTRRELLRDAREHGCGT